MKMFKFFSVAALAMLAWTGTAHAQSRVTVTADPVQGSKNTYTLTITPYSTAMVTELNNLNTERKMFSKVEAAGNIVTVTVSDAKMTEENLESYLTGYLDYKSRGAAGNQ